MYFQRQKRAIMGSDPRVFKGILGNWDTGPYVGPGIPFQGCKVRNSLPDEVKMAKNIKRFKELIKLWFLENRCECSFGRNQENAILEAASC